MKSRGRSKRSHRDDGKLVIPSPPEIKNLSITYSCRRRFTTTTVVTNLQITWANLLDSVFLSTTATAGFQLFDYVRVRAIHIWSITTQGAVTSATIQFNGTATGMMGDGRQHNATSIGVEPAYLTARPAPKSYAALFQASTSNNAFLITCAAGSVIDLELDFRNGMTGNAPTAVSSAPVAVTAGDVFFRGFDGQAIASTKFTPVGTVSVA